MSSSSPRSKPKGNPGKKRRNLFGGRLPNWFMPVLVTVATILAIVAVWQLAKPEDRPHLRQTTPKPLPALTQKQVQVVLLQPNGQTLQTVTVNQPASPHARQRLQTAVTLLLQGPGAVQAPHATSEVPPEARVLSVTETAEHYRVNLSAAFAQGGGADAMTLRLEQLIRTVLLTQPDKPVFLDLEGQQADVLGGEGVEVPQPLKLQGGPV
jgi:spore germination protein GerM